MTDDLEVAQRAEHALTGNYAHLVQAGWPPALITSLTENWGTYHLGLKSGAAGQFARASLRGDDVHWVVLHDAKLGEYGSATVDVRVSEIAYVGNNGWVLSSPSPQPIPVIITSVGKNT